MSSKALVWPVRSLLALNSCPKRFNGLQHSHISQSAIQRPSRLHAYRVNPNNRRGDEYGPMWPPTPSAADEDDGAPCLSVLLDDTPKSHDRQEGPNFKGPQEILQHHADVICCVDGAGTQLQGPSKPVKGSLCSGNWRLAHKSAHAIAQTPSRFPYMDRCLSVRHQYACEQSYTPGGYLPRSNVPCSTCRWPLCCCHSERSGIFSPDLCVVPRYDLDR